MKIGKTLLNSLHQHGLPLHQTKARNVGPQDEVLLNRGGWHEFRAVESFAVQYDDEARPIIAEAVIFTFTEPDNGVILELSLEWNEDVWVLDRG